MQLKDGWSPEGKEYYSRFLLTAILNGELSEQLLERMAEIQALSRKIKPAARTEFLNTLRGLVDQWIDSGKSDGIEDAWKRNIKWQPPTRQKTITETLLDYRHRNPPRAETGDDGRFEIWMLPACLASTEPLLRARDMAIYHFVYLLDSSTRERFSRCDECRAYFVRARAPKKDTPIYHGTFCQECKNKGGAKRTLDSRERRTKERIGWAAECWPKWTKHRGPRSVWVAEQVNRRVERHPISWDTITGKWVTRHQREIEEKAEGRNYAAGKNQES